MHSDVDTDDVNCFNMFKEHANLDIIVKEVHPSYGEILIQATNAQTSPYDRAVLLVYLLFAVLAEYRYTC